MGKQGPCCHCGISITPLWRNGPVDKPVLCNACGSRWRTKGTLINYMPIHSGGLGLKSGSTKKSTQNLSDHHSRKRKELSDDDFVYPRSNHTTGILLEEETSTRSSTDSFSESCTQHVLAASRASDCWPPWGSHAPSKRRTVMHRRPHLFPCSRLSSNPFKCKISVEDDLLVEYRPSSMTAEIGLGGMLIRPIVSTNTAQESQASSHLFDNKELDQSIAFGSDVIREQSLNVHIWDQSIKPRAKEKTKLSARSIGAINHSSANTWVPNKTLLESFPYNKHDVLQSCHSPLVFVELKDIINFDLYESLLSKQEQQQLVKHVSPADSSLRCMFSSAQFESALRGFQDLLSEGMFDSLASGISLGVLQHYQQLLTLSNLTTSGWMESCSQLLHRGRRNGSTKYVKTMQGKEYLRGTNTLATDVVSSSIDLMATKNPTSSVTTERALKKSYPQPAASRQKGSGKCDRIEKKRGNQLKFDAKNVHLLSKGKRSSANQGILVEAPFYGVLEHEILLDLPSSLSFQQAELLPKRACSKSPPQEAGMVVDQSKRNDDTISQNMLPCEGDLDWSSYLFSVESVNDSV